MVAYKVILSKQVRKKDLQKVSAKTKQRIVRAIGGLQTEPRPGGAVKLTNREEYRLRVSDYRVLYVVNDDERVVEMRKVAHRGNVYDR